MPVNELERFLNTWDREAENTQKLMRALPASQYDFRPDQGGRSLGELAWHLAEGDAYISFGIENGQFTMDMKPPHVEPVRWLARSRKDWASSSRSCRRSRTGRVRITRTVNP